MVNWIKSIINKIKMEIRYRKRLKELRKRDPLYINDTRLSAGFPDAGATLIDKKGNILFAGHARTL